ncbi:MAG: type 1 glutamine amidotransferase [Desulfobacterales bacterium]|nr:type 1 glutamine amidotransferase [Desulfobacterales bacterium]
MRIHYLQHVPFEDLSSIEPILREKAHELTATHLYKGQQMPLVKKIDWLIVMGGPMGIYDEVKYPWLNAEKLFIKEAIESNKIVLGICLGAQLIADALGAKVYQNKHREIGWFNISRSPEVDDTVLSEVIPDQIEVFHWHGDTFDIPQRAKAIGASEACRNQGFIINNRIVGFQFHLETTLQSASALINNCRDELDKSQYVQTESEILSDNQRFTNINQVMYSVLESLEVQNNRQRS